MTKIKSVRAVQVAGIEVADAPMRQIVEALSTRPSHPVLCFALHVGGLNAASNRDVRAAYAAGDLTYADGVAVVLLARLAGARSIERTPTTDLGPLLMHALSRHGDVRAFLLGGPHGLAEAAGIRLARDHGVTVVGTVAGYDIDPGRLLERLKESRPDVVLVGLGAPFEMQFLAGLRTTLPPALYVTCGGWFGFLAGEERRAPQFLQRLGLEWTWRLRQHPRRLVCRYIRGLWTTSSLAVALILRRVMGRAVDHGPLPPVSEYPAGRPEPPST